MHKNSNAAFWLVGYSLMILMAGTNIPSPLYSVYQHQMGFSSGIISLIFAVYALVLIPSLLVFGQLSDRFGRKKVLLIGLVIAAAGSATFVFATNLVWLFVARGLQGLAAGMMSGTATAALVELRPDHRKTASLVATIATAGGSGVGPLLGGILAQYAPSPLVLPYIVHIILFIPGFIAILIMSETIKSKSSGSWRLQRPSVPSTIRMPFIMGAVTSFAAWSVMALFMSLLPSYISSLMGIHNLAVTGGGGISSICSFSHHAVYAQKSSFSDVYDLWAQFIDHWPCRGLIRGPHTIRFIVNDQCYHHRTRTRSLLHGEHGACQ
ncbi:Major Facilitator Superfamily protein [Salibacterium halotolerans]|uniref:Major Facilitator Superfamily protein n=1 Tax=Salibacterium halotolerans TaxID=1884432 RepID=A0A1I5YEH9_9BACI|nr:Major Facilitator Superfamily protein [Salibacterium halotolerans]